jgi:hypothetical protein
LAYPGQKIYKSGDFAQNYFFEPLAFNDRRSLDAALDAELNRKHSCSEQTQKKATPTKKDHPEEEFQWTCLVNNTRKQQTLWRCTRVVTWGGF